VVANLVVPAELRVLVGDGVEAVGQAVTIFVTPPASIVSMLAFAIVS